MSESKSFLVALTSWSRPGDIGKQGEEPGDYFFKPLDSSLAVAWVEFVSILNSSVPNVGRSSPSLMLGMMFCLALRGPVSALVVLLMPDSD